MLTQLPPSAATDYLNRRSPDNQGTLLHHAAGRGYSDLALLFIKLGADPHLPDRNGFPAEAWLKYKGAPRRSPLLRSDLPKEEAHPKSSLDVPNANPLHFTDFKAMPLEIVEQVFKQLSLRDLANVVAADPPVAPIVRNLYPQRVPTTQTARTIARKARLLRRRTKPKYETARTLPAQEVIASLNVARAMHKHTQSYHYRRFVHLAALEGYKTSYPNDAGSSVAENILRSHEFQWLSSAHEPPPKMVVLRKMLLEGIAEHQRLLPIALATGSAEGVNAILTTLPPKEAQRLAGGVEPRALFAIRDTEAGGASAHGVLGALFTHVEKGDAQRFVNFVDDEHPRSLLHWAAVNRRYDLFATLLQHGGNPNLPDRTPYKTTARGLSTYDPHLQEALARAPIAHSQAP